MGRLRYEVVAPGGEAVALTVGAGQLLEVADREGQQVADLIAFAARDRTEGLSTGHTRSALLRLVVGDRLQSNWRRPMFEIVLDDVGVHDVITAMCDARRHALDYGVLDHPSCRSNLTQALRPWGIAEWQIPAPVNLFQNAPISGDRSFGNQVPTSRAGDRIVLLCHLDAVVGVSPGARRAAAGGAARAPLLGEAEARAVDQARTLFASSTWPTRRTSTRAPSAAGRSVSSRSCAA